MDVARCGKARQAASGEKGSIHRPNLVGAVVRGKREFGADERHRRISRNRKKGVSRDTEHRHDRRDRL